MLHRQRRILPGRFSRFFRLVHVPELCTRTESDAWDSVTSHNGNTVGREGPFICQWAGFTHSFSFSISYAGFTVESFIRLFQSFGYFVVFRNGPGREVAFDFVFASCIGRTVIIVHGNDNIISVFLNAWKCSDLIQTAFPCFSECHTTVKGNSAGVSNSAAAWGSVENLGYSYSTSSKETCLLPI